MARIAPSTWSERGRLRVGILVVGLLDLVVIFLGTYPKTATWFTLAWSIGSLGVITFLGYLMIGNFIQSHEVRAPSATHALATNQGKAPEGPPAEGTATPAGTAPAGAQATATPEAARRLLATTKTEVRDAIAVTFMVLY